MKTEPESKATSEDPMTLQKQVMESFQEFEASFRRNNPLLWLCTVLIPPVLTVSLLVLLAIVNGTGYVRTLLLAALFTFFGAGRFAIPLVDQLPWLPLDRFEVFLLITYMDLMVALIIPFHIGLFFRMPGIGPKISALVADGQFILSSNPWMKRASFLGLVMFVMFPLAATGSVGGAIFSRLLGMSRLASIVAISIGSLLGNGLMWLFADLIETHLNPENPFVKYGGLAVIVLIVIILERRYQHAKKRFIASQTAQSQKNQTASPDKPHEPSDS